MPHFMYNEYYLNTAQCFLKPSNDIFKFKKKKKNIHDF